MSGLSEFHTAVLRACAAQPQHINGLLRHLSGPHPRRVAEALEVLRLRGLVRRQGDYYARATPLEVAA